MNVHVNAYELRPCYVKGRKAMFHGWHHAYYVVPPSPVLGGYPGGQMSNLYAIVEYENGCCDLAEYDYVRFIDNGAFKEIAWPEEEQHD